MLNVNLLKLGEGKGFRFTEVTWASLAKTSHALDFAILRKDMPLKMMYTKEKLQVSIVCLKT